MLTSLFSSLGAKIAAGTLIAATAAGGVAAANGVLPEDAQNAVADAAAHLNITLPRSAGHGADVTDAVFNGDYDPSDGEDYGENVADVADQDNRDEGDATAEDSQSSGSDVSDPYRP